MTLLSWAVGVAFGRFDIRLATGERAMPPEPDPFDPLPTKSPGMLPTVTTPRSCHVAACWWTTKVMQTISWRVSPQSTIISANGTEPEVRAPHARARLLSGPHQNVLSKSRRKAPIYWQLATPSVSYSVWLYVHAFTKDTLFRVQNDYVAPKLAHEQRQLEAIRADAGQNPSGAQRKSIAAMESLIEELQAFLEEVKRIAPLWNPNLDDGVIINFAPLWRLVPQHKPWQNELRSTWDEALPVATTGRISPCIFGPNA